MYSLTSAAKAAGENKALIAALKRCAAQNRGTVDLFSILLTNQPLSDFVYQRQSIAVSRND
jgi:hypothetical protein